MNLVAKEYVAAQNPENPGVLVLSKYAGAANELDAALLVNPHDVDGMARAIATALSMPLTERRMRWEAMMAKLRVHTIQQWSTDFIDALGESQLACGPLGPILPDPPTLWPLRSINGGVRYH
ncbi:trehalose-6-phosphate synthase, partial [Acinetobacter baumannii]|uniref:trehalose-6-phosphate synthase n=1 Tax=Acinetobacter baumannii TaxID=470 RepID=UPI0034D53723